MTEDKLNPTVVDPEQVEAPQGAEAQAESSETQSPSEPEQMGAEPMASSGPDKKFPTRKKVVKKLSLGQEVTGTVTRVTEFGAFVDIGVGRDGLVHVTELGGGRGTKPTDVVSEGQEIIAWIKTLDREKNRIGLTMRRPPSVDVNTLQVDQTVTGTVMRIVSYGAFVDIGTGREALLHVREMASDYVKNPASILSVGDEIEARIIKLDPQTKQIDLSIRQETEPEPDVEEEIVVEEAEEDAPTAMELALKAALASQEDKGSQPTSAGRAPRRRKENVRGEQEDILSRTLELHKKGE